MNKMSVSQLKQVAERLFSAQQNQTVIPPLCDEFPDLDLTDAYRIQDYLRDLHVKAGNIVAGYKMGLTNRVKMQEQGLSEPLHGYLFSSLIFLDNSVIPMQQLIQPRVECEVAFIMAKDICGPGITAQNVIDATDYIVPALEIVDSRYQDFKFAFNDGVADNICGAMVVLGGKLVRLQDIDLANINVLLEINGKIVAQGESSIVLDNPANAVAMLINMLASDGLVLRAGSIVMSGMIAGAIAINTSDKINAIFSGLGSVGATASHHQPYMW